METLRFGPLAATDGSRVCAVQTGWLRHGTRRREMERWVIPVSTYQVFGRRT